MPRGPTDLGQFCAGEDEASFPLCEDSAQMAGLQTYEVLG